ncbi:MAG: NAD(P)-dependent oxidoreductase [Rhodothermales bacterium]
MRLLILGASGRCGQWAVRLAHRRGHSLRVVVRPGTDFEAPSGVEVMRGSVLEPMTVLKAVEGQDAVVSCLGPKRKNPRNPWSKLDSPDDIAARSARYITAAMANHNVSRGAAISAAGVGDSRHRLSPVLRWFLDHSSIGLAYRDLDRMEQQYTASGLDWLVVRPVTLVDGPPTSKVRVVDRYRLLSRVSRGDVSQWLLDGVESEGPFFDSRVMIGWR